MVAASTNVGVASVAHPPAPGLGADALHQIKGSVPVLLADNLASRLPRRRNQTNSARYSSPVLDGVAAVPLPPFPCMTRGNLRKQ